MANPQPRRSLSKWKVVLFVFIGWLLFMGLYFYFSKMEEYHGSIKAKGEVIDMLWAGGGRGKYGSGRYQYPQFSFVYEDSTYISSDKNMYAKTRSIGDRVTVIFTPDNPGEARIYSVLTYWVSFPALLISGLLIGLVFGILFVIGQYDLYKKESRLARRK